LFHLAAIGTRPGDPRENSDPDINQDGKVDGRDITIAARPSAHLLGDPRWNLDCDINGDGRVDGRDIAIVARNFGKQSP